MPVFTSVISALICEGLKKDIPYLSRDISIKEIRGRPSSVMILVGQRLGRDVPEILLTKRSVHVETHKGQIAFPGGMHDPEDGDPNQDLIHTALRELEEEVGISRDQVEVLGALPDLFTFSSAFKVRPFVGWLNKPWDQVVLKPHVGEIEEIFFVPFSDVMLSPLIFKEEIFDYKGKQIPTPVFYWNNHRIWGATGAMIKNLLKRCFE